MSMRVARRYIALLLVMVALTVGLTGVVGCSADEPTAPEPAPAPAPEPAPEPDAGSEIPEADAGRALVESKCAGCHNLDRVWAKTADAAGWESTVSRMEAQGLRVTDEERATIIEYLAGQ